MKRNFALALGLIVGSSALAGSAVAQLPPGTPVPTNLNAPVGSSTYASMLAKQRREVDAFKNGFEISLDGGTTWTKDGRYLVSPCPTSTTSPCGAGAPTLAFMVRWPLISTAGDVSGGKHYEINLAPGNSVSSSQAAPICGAGGRTDYPGVHVGVNPLNPYQVGNGTIMTTGADMFFTCSWVVTAVVHDDLVITHPTTLIVSNMVHVLLTGK